MIPRIEKTDHRQDSFSLFSDSASAVAPSAPILASGNGSRSTSDVTRNIRYPRPKNCIR